MRLLLLTLEPLDATPAPALIGTIDAFRRAGHELYLVAPLRAPVGVVQRALGVPTLLPLYPGQGWLPFLLNTYRVSHWGRQWRAELYLSFGTRSALLAHGARGATGGYGLSVLLLPTLPQSTNWLWRWLDRHAIHECDRLLTPDAALVAPLIEGYHARGGDLHCLPGGNTQALVSRCEAFLAEPPGLH